MALIFDSISIIPIPPYFTSPISVLHFIRSFLFQIKWKINLFIDLIISEHGDGNIDILQINLEIARLLIINVFPNIVNFLFFHDSKCLSSFFQFISPIFFFNTLFFVVSNVIPRILFSVPFKSPRSIRSVLSTVYLTTCQKSYQNYL